MPSLFRFLIFLGILVGIAYGAIFSLARFVEPQPREITINVPHDKFFKNR